MEQSTNFCKKHLVQSICRHYKHCLTFCCKEFIMFINITLSISAETINSSPNKSEPNDDDIIDDFKEVFNPFGIRIIFFSLWIIYVTISNAFFALLILYEKYGEDIMKRSINNQLVSQLGLAMILHNCVLSTIFLLRFIFGPLYFGIVVFEVFIANIYVSWVLLVLSEISIVKALSIYKFSWIVGIDENFAGRYLLTFNVGYSFVSQTARFVHKFSSITFFLNLIFQKKTFLFNFRYFLGSFFYTVHFQLLSGIQLLSRPNMYGPIYHSIIFFLSTVAFVITNIKKMKERYKEWKFHQNINVNLNEQHHYEGQMQFNNVKNNFPLLSRFQIALLVGFVLAGNVIFWFLDFAFNDSKYYYKQFMFKTLTLMFIYNIVIPIIYLIKKKKMRKYLWKYICDEMF